jgi:hypothetical protein
MNLAYTHLVPEDFADDSRVWIYQSNRLFRLSEALDIEESINAFCGDWKSHGAEVRGYGNLFFGQFLVLMADERATGVSGCSTDSSVRFVKELGQQYGVDFFERTNLAFIIKDQLQVLPMNQLSYAFENGFVSADTLFFNNTVTTKAEFQHNWIIPVKASWLAQKLRISA